MPQLNRAHRDETPVGNRAIGFAIVIAVAVAAHGLILRNEFVNWDDPHTISGNFRITPATLAGLAACWREPQGHLWVPITYSVWWVVSALTPVAAGSQSPLPAFGFHLVSLLAHVVASLAVLSLLTRLVRDGRAALLGALIFAAHPVQVEAVAWASGLKDVLYGMFLLLGLRAYVAAADRRGASRWIWWTLATLGALAAMLSKPTAMVAPVLALAVDRAATARPWRKCVAFCAPWLLMAIPIGYIAARAQHPSLPTLDQSVAGRLIVAGDALCFYLRKLVVPLPLGVDYGRRPAVIAGDAWRALSWAVPVGVAVVFGLALRRRPRRRRELGAAGVLFVVPLLPVLGFVPFDFQQYSTVANHYLYLPMAGVALAVASIAAEFRARAIWREATTGRRPLFLAAGASAALVGALVLLSARQARTWQDTQSLFRQALVANPTSWAAYDNLAALKIDDEDYTSALALAGQAAQYGPWAAGPQITLGLARAHLGDDDNAAAAFGRAIAIEPGNAVARVNLGRLRARQGRPHEALQLFTDAIQLDSEDAEAHLNLGVLLDQADRPGEALAELTAAVRLAPGNAIAHADLGVLLAEQHRLAEARRELGVALRLDPNNGAARRTLESIATQP